MMRRGVVMMRHEGGRERGRLRPKMRMTNDDAADDDDDDDDDDVMMMMMMMMMKMKMKMIMMMMMMMMMMTVRRRIMRLDPQLRIRRMNKAKQMKEDENEDDYDDE